MDKTRKLVTHTTGKHATISGTIEDMEKHALTRLIKS
jgi:hypothetical protein